MKKLQTISENIVHKSSNNNLFQLWTDLIGIGYYPISQFPSTMKNPKSSSPTEMCYSFFISHYFQVTLNCCT